MRSDRGRARRPAGVAIAFALERLMAVTLPPVFNAHHLESS
jgi:hypothetical protein